MAITKVPSYISLQDQQFIQIQGPDGLLSGFQYDLQQRALYAKESQVIFPSFHGATHIAEDPIPSATCDSPGLMTADDKCKLDALIATRVGVLGFQGAGFCIAPGCRVLMADGVHKPIETIKIGDVIISHTGKPRVVDNVYQRNIDELLYAVDCRGHRKGGLKLTGDHKVLAIKRSDVVCIHPECKARVDLPCRHNNRNCNGCEYEGLARATPQWVKTRDLEIGDFVMARHSSAITHHMPSLEVASVIKVKVRDDRAYTTAKLTHVYHKKQPTGLERICTTSKTSLPARLVIGPDLLKLFGYYLAEGYSGKKKLGFAIHKDELVEGDIGGEIKRIMLSLFGVVPSVVYKEENNGVELIYSHATLARLLGALFGHKSTLKRLPRFLMELPSYLQQYLIIGIMQGDGYSKNAYASKILSIQLASQELVEQISFLLERCGGRPTLQKPKYRLDLWALKKGKKITRTSYCLTVQANTVPWLWKAMGRLPYYKQNRFALDMVQGDFLYHEVQKITAELYNGPVHDLSVAEDHSFIVNGLAVHNSDDGGWMSGDIILAAGTEFISIERIGNIVRFTCDSPVPLNCACEECTQIFWVQDETDVSAIRPPSCGGKFPGVNAYGELKIFLFPESTLSDPSNPAATIIKKDQYPALIFKRYDNAITPGSGEFDLILQRSTTNLQQTDIGWSMTPGSAGVAQSVWFMGRDNDGNLMRFDLSPSVEPDLLGSVLFNGHLITKKMGVIVDYTPTILGTNIYIIRNWDVDGQGPIGTSFNARNVWQYANPENPSSGSNPKTLLLDATIDLLPIGSLVDIWAFKVGEVAGEAIIRYYFSKKPSINPNNIWTWVGQTQFGDSFIARQELEPNVAATDKISSALVNGIRDFERSMWGLTGYDDPLIIFDLASTAGTIAAEINQQHRAVIDTSLPGLTVVAATNTPSFFSERPVVLWNRQSTCNAIIKADIGKPSSSEFVPYDFLLRAPIDESTDKYMRVDGTGVVNGDYYVRVSGAHFHDLPPFGAIRILSPHSDQNLIYNYSKKLMFPTAVGEEASVTNPTITGALVDAFDSIVLIGVVSNNVPFPGNIGDIVELLHQEYDSVCVRVEMSIDDTTGEIQVQFKVGTLDMGLPYEEDIVADYADDFVRGLAPGYEVSAIYTQVSSFTGVGSQPSASPTGFVIYDGGTQVGGALSEYWNTIEIMLRDNQVWIWWNRLLIPPSTTLSKALQTPVDITTPYFTVIQDPNRTFGKAGVRLWPGAAIRRMSIRTQVTMFSEFSYGQIELA